MINFRSSLTTASRESSPPARSGSARSHNRRFGRGRWLVAAVVVVGGTASMSPALASEAPGPGEASNPKPNTLPQAAGVTIVKADSVENSSFAKSVTANCPAGTSVTNAGADIHGGVLNDRSYVVIDDLFPNEAPTSVTVTAIENRPSSHFTLDWSVTAIATCSPTPDLLSWQWAQSVTDSDWGKEVFAYCPPGTVVWGGGATIEGGDGRVVIDQIYPYTDGSLEVRAYESDGTHDDWNVNALAICAEEPDGYEIIRGSDDLYDGSSGKANVVSCSDDLVATGGGFEIHTFNGGQMNVDKLDFSASVDPTVLLVQAFETRGVAFPSDPLWALVPNIICGDV